MQKLFDFIREKKHWLILIIVQLVSLNLYLNDGMYRQGIKLYASSILAGYANELVSQAYSYLDLKQANSSLIAENARLQEELVLLRRHIADTEATQALSEISRDSLSAGYVTARIINMRHEGGEAYYVIDRGQKHGIKVDMPVMSHRGVVGAVMEVSNSYAIVIPIINPKTKLSCMIRGKGYQGQVTTQGYNQPVYFGGTSLQADIAKGDTITTSGYSYIYPEGLMVGTVEDKDPRGAVGAAAAFGSYRIKLYTAFDKIRHVYVMLMPPMTEARNLEDSITHHD